MSKSEASTQLEGLFSSICKPTYQQKLKEIINSQ